MGMSQQGAGADDWWQKLYEDPDAVPEPDPGDTLDHRFRSATNLTTDPPPTPPAPPPPAVPPQPARPPGPVSVPPWEGASQGLLPGPRTAPDPGGPGVPPPRDPRAGGVTGYALGDVDVPPVQPPAEPPPWRWEVPREEDLTRDLTQDLTGDLTRDLPQDLTGDLTGGLPAGPPEELTGGLAGGSTQGPSQGPSGELTGGPAQDLTGESTEELPGELTRELIGELTQELAGGLPGGLVEQGAMPAPVSEEEAAAPRPPRPAVEHLGDRAPTYAAEPGRLPAADPAGLDALTPDTVLEGAHYGTYTLRAASLRGDSARFRGEARRDFLLTARFGSGEGALVLVALAGGDRAAPGAAAAAAELCRTVAAAVGRSQQRLADDILAGRRDALRSGLQRLTDRGYGRLRTRAAELGLAEDAYTAGLRGLLLPVDPNCRTRVSFGAGAGGLFRLRGGHWEDLEPAGRPGQPGQPGRPDPADPPEGTGFRFRASVARPGDTLLLCSGGLADPMREEDLLPAELAARWSEAEPPGLAAFLADTQLRLKGYADDRTAAAVWEA